MNNLIKINSQTIKSTELVEIINDFRKQEGNKTELQHYDFMKKIKKELETLKNIGIEGQGNFSESSYINLQNKKQPCFELTRDGMLEMLNSESAFVRFKTIEYINKLEKKVKKPLSSMDTLRLQYQVLEEHEGKLNRLDIKVDDLENNMPLFNVECKEIQALVRKTGMRILGGYHSKAYKDNSLRGKVYADIQHELRREFGVRRYEAIKRCQIEKAKEIISNYKAPTVLKDQIVALNNQISMEVV